MEIDRGFEAVVPSNIALLKYWGKKDEGSQWPANDSLSITLADLVTKTKAFLLKEADDHRFVLHGEQLGRTAPLAGKAFRQLDFLAAKFSFPQKLLIVSENNFPTGCGIASSASGLGALTLAALAAWTEADSWQSLQEHGFDRPYLAALARMGSGSACRSFWGGVVQWEAGAQAEAQRVYPLVEAKHWQLEDTIVLFSQHEKKVSSSQAHQAAWSSPLFAPRLAELPERAEKMRLALAAKDMEQLGPLIEQEALEMHAVIMTASPATHYFDEHTAQFLAWLRRIRREHKIAVYFTLDAGPNVHLIGEKAQQERLRPLLHRHFPQLKYLYDQMGEGPSLRMRMESPAPYLFPGKSHAT